ncbi:MAG: cupin domain-containing protein [Mesorhizobium sp.]
MALRHANAGQIVDLQPLGAALKQARTSAIVKSDLFEAVRLVVGAGKDIKPHKVDGPITLHCLEGRALLRLPTETLELTVGQWVYLDAGEPHSVTGIEDSSFLLTILFPTGSKKPTSETTPHGGIDADTKKTVEGLESLLDEGLEGTFPASDPVAVSDPSTGIRITRGRESGSR